MIAIALEEKKARTVRRNSSPRVDVTRVRQTSDLGDAGRWRKCSAINQPAGSHDNQPESDEPSGTGLGRLSFWVKSRIGDSAGAYRSTVAQLRINRRRLVSGCSDEIRVNTAR